MLSQGRLTLQEMSSAISLAKWILEINAHLLSVITILPRRAHQLYKDLLWIHYCQVLHSLIFVKEKGKQRWLFDHTGGWTSIGLLETDRYTCSNDLASHALKFWLNGNHSVSLHLQYIAALFNHAHVRKCHFATLMIFPQTHFLLAKTVQININ